MSNNIGVKCANTNANPIANVSTKMNVTVNNNNKSNPNLVTVLNTTSPSSAPAPGGFVGTTARLGAGAGTGVGAMQQQVGAHAPSAPLQPLQIPPPATSSSVPISSSLPTAVADPGPSSVLPVSSQRPVSSTHPVITNTTKTTSAATATAAATNVRTINASTASTGSVAAPVSSMKQPRQPLSQSQQQQQQQHPPSRTIASGAVQQSPSGGITMSMPISMPMSHPQTTSAAITTKKPVTLTTGTATAATFVNVNNNISSSGGGNKINPMNIKAGTVVSAVGVAPAASTTTALGGIKHSTKMAQYQQSQQKQPQTQPQPQSKAILAPLNRKNKNLSEKKIRRLEKNRLSARNCRRKKKEVTQNLQREIAILEGQNLRLRLQLQIGQEAEQLSKEEQDRVTEGLDTLLKGGASDSEIYLNIEEFKEKYADYGRDTRSAIDFHLRNVERLLMPTTTTTVAMRALDGGMNVTSGSGNSGNSAGNANANSPSNINAGGSKKDTLNACTSTSNDSGSTSSIKVENKDNFPEHEKNKAGVTTGTSAATVLNKAQGGITVENKILNQKTPPTSETKTGVAVATMANVTKTTQNQQQQQKQKQPSVAPKSLFQYLVNYLQVTPSQAAALKDSRHVAKELDAALVKSLAMLQELRETLTQCTDDLDAEFTTIRSILTPRQAAKFLVWVANNGACMHMLNELWSRQYPDPKVNDEGDFLMENQEEEKKEVGALGGGGNGGSGGTSSTEATKTDSKN
mmetsp:Transcript_10801/g.16308  ORF Transcript_10801/g.16308 Transcript_10801/m.16308 type:complete len:745 (-) Transcript_10801:28-2262(-)